MAMEAINQAGHLKSRLIVILNDNEMSIAPAVGALTGYLNRIRGAHGYHRFKDEVEERSEEHTSELQSPCNLVCRLLLEKKKKTVNSTNNYILYSKIVNIRSYH